MSRIERDRKWMVTRVSQSAHCSLTYLLQTKPEIWLLWSLHFRQLYHCCSLHCLVYAWIYFLGAALSMCFFSILKLAQWAQKIPCVPWVKADSLSTENPVYCMSQSWLGAHRKPLDYLDQGWFSEHRTSLVFPGLKLAQCTQKKISCVPCVKAGSVHKENPLYSLGQSWFNAYRKSLVFPGSRLDQEAQKIPCIPWVTAGSVSTENPLYSMSQGWLNAHRTFRILWVHPVS